MSQSDPSGEFARRAQMKSRGALGEMWDFLRNTKKWWLVPVIVVLLLLGALVILGATGAAPFIYTLF